MSPEVFLQKEKEKQNKTKSGLECTPTYQRCRARSQGFCLGIRGPHGSREKFFRASIFGAPDYFWHLHLPLFPLLLLLSFQSSASLLFRFCSLETLKADCWEDERHSQQCLARRLMGWVYEALLHFSLSPSFSLSLFLSLSLPLSLSLSALVSTLIHQIVK